MQTKQRRTCSDEEQRQRATTFFMAIYFKIIMSEISPIEAGRDDVCEPDMGNTVRSVLYSRLTPA